MTDQNMQSSDDPMIKPISEVDDFDDLSPDLSKDSKNENVDSPDINSVQHPSPIASHFLMTDTDIDVPNQSTEGTVQQIPIDKISANPYQPRKYFDPAKLAELSESIKFQGIIQPLVLTKSSDGYEILVGERRYRAALLGGLSVVPAIVRGEISDRAKLELALIENVQREDLNPIEEARAYARLSEEFGLTQEQIAKKVGKSRPAVANIVRLLNLPAQIQRSVIEGQLTEGHARAILPLENDFEKQMEVFEWMIRDNATVRDAENKVREIKNLPLKPYLRATKGKQTDPELKAMEDNLREKLGTRVRLQKTGDSGRILIEFFSNEELQQILHKLGE